jgi:hypothetical protein
MTSNPIERAHPHFSSGSHPERSRETAPLGEIRRRVRPRNCSLILGLSDALAAKSNGLSRRRKRAMIDPFLDDYSLRP